MYPIHYKLSPRAGIPYSSLHPIVSPQMFLACWVGLNKHEIIKYEATHKHYMGSLGVNEPMLDE